MATVYSDPRRRVALETTLLAHGVPRESALELGLTLESITRTAGGIPATIGVLRGRPTIGLTPEQLKDFLTCDPIAKANSANLGVLIHQGQTAATTVSATVELAAGQGIGLLATGGIGGVHPMGGRGGMIDAATTGIHGSENRATTGIHDSENRAAAGKTVPIRPVSCLDISSDLLALAKFPVAVISSGCKAILDVAATREALETLGVPVIGFGTDEFPAFTLRSAGEDIFVDARFDDLHDLARFVRHELARTSKGMLIANPIPDSDAIAPEHWQRWLDEAQQRIGEEGVAGRDVTPRLLALMHELSKGATLRANIALVKSNARLAAELAHAMYEDR